MLSFAHVTLMWRLLCYPLRQEDMRQTSRRQMSRHRWTRDLKEMQLMSGDAVS